jgi:hypothetical protein
MAYIKTMDILKAFHVHRCDWIAHLDIYVMLFIYRDTRLIEKFMEKPHFNFDEFYRFAKERWKEIDYYLDAIWC